MPSIFLSAAGAAMMLHFALGALARVGLRDRPALEAELFGIPNRWLGTSPRLRLLRVRYFFPVRAMPEELEELEGWVRASLTAARLAGFGFLAAFVGFFAALFAKLHAKGSDAAGGASQQP